MKKLSPILLGLLLSLPFTAQANFPDIQDQHPNKTAIEYLKNNNIIQGYPDGTFKPENILNRAELTKIAILSEGITPATEDLDCFPDVKASDWFAPFVCAALEEGIIQGYPDGTFKPGNEINRAESLVIIANAGNKNVQNSSPTNQYSDLPKNEWFTDYVNYFSDLNYLPFQLKIEADKKLTRREFSEIYYRVLTNNNQKFQPEFPDTSQQLVSNPDDVLLMLDLINQERTSRDLQPVELSNELSYMGELHSQDMIDRNFFSHDNPDGGTIDIRRKELGIATFVGENISTNISVQASHTSLMNSPGHKANILNPIWNRVGLGIIKSGNLYYISQEFSIYEENESTIIEEIIKKSNTTLNQNSNLQKAAEKWAPIMAERKQASNSINGQTAQELPELNGLNISIGTGLASLTTDLEALITAQLEFLQTSYTEYGIAGAKSEDGDIYFIIITK